MSGLVVFVALAVAAADTSNVADQRPNVKTVEPRRYSEINADIRDALRDEALAETMQERASAIRQVALLYRELVKDPRLETSDTLKKYKAKLWSRMTHVKKDLQQQLDRDAKKGKHEKK